MNYIGIDPGKSGAMAVIWDGGGVEVFGFSTENYKRTLSDLELEECRCCLERVGAMPKQGVNSMFHFGENYGFIQGLLTATLSPMSW